MRVSQDPSRDTDHVIDETELPQSSGQEPNVAPVPEQPYVRCLILNLQKHLANLLKRPMVIMTNRHQPSPSRTQASHIGNGDQRTKCLLRNLMILWRREDELLQRDLRQLLRARIPTETDEIGPRFQNCFH